MTIDEKHLKQLFFNTLDYIDEVFDPRFLKEWLKWNRLQLTFEKHDKKPMMKEEQFDSWVDEWKGKKNETIPSKEQ